MVVPMPGRGIVRHTALQRLGTTSYSAGEVVITPGDIMWCILGFSESTPGAEVTQGEIIGATNDLDQGYLTSSYWTMAVSNQDTPVYSHTSEQQVTNQDQGTGYHQYTGPEQVTTTNGYNEFSVTTKQVTTNNDIEESSNSENYSNFATNLMSGHSTTAEETVYFTKNLNSEHFTPSSSAHVDSKTISSDNVELSTIPVTGNKLTPFKISCPVTLSSLGSDLRRSVTTSQGLIFFQMKFTHALCTSVGSTGVS